MAISHSPFEHLIVLPNKIIVDIVDKDDNHYCTLCNKYHEQDEMLLINNKMICFDCLKEHYGITFNNCKYCGRRLIETYHSQSMVELIVNEYKFPLSYYGFCIGCYCYKCHYQDCDCVVVEGHKYCCNHIGYERLHQYGFKPEPIFKGDLANNKDFYIGVELELNFNNAEDRLNFLNQYDTDFFYCKRDGSLSNFGVEIVSHPATLDYHINSRCWTKLFKLLDQYQLNTKNCGIHFHISKDNLSIESIYNIDYLVNHYDGIINEIGSRGYTSFATKTKVGVYEYGKYRRSNHYDACNLCNDKTIELRFCKSTYNLKTFMKKIKMIFALVYLCEQVNHKQIHNKGYIKKAFNIIKNEIMSRM